MRGSPQTCARRKDTNAMPNAGQLLSRLVTVTLNRDGQAHALERDLRSGGEARELDTTDGESFDAGQSGASAPVSRRHRPSIPPETIILESVALKVLNAWLQNRHQTLYPLAMNFRNLTQPERELIVQAMAAAASADGQVDDNEQRQVLLSLERVGAGEAEHQMIMEAIAHPKPLNTILREIQEANLSAFAYGASLLAINQRNRVNQIYLEYLAARLALPPEVAHSLNRRYRA